MELEKYISLIYDNVKISKNGVASKLSLEAYLKYPEDKRAKALYEYFLKHEDKTNRKTQSFSFTPNEILDYLKEIEKKNEEELQVLIPLICNEIPTNHNGYFMPYYNPIANQSLQKIEEFKSKLNQKNNNTLKPCIDKMNAYIALEENYTKDYIEKCYIEAKKTKNRKIKKVVLFSFIVVIAIVIILIVILR